MSMVKIFRIKGKKVSKKQYEEQMKAIHASKHQQYGSGKKRLAEAKKKQEKRPQRYRQMDYKKTHAKTIDVSRDKISQDDLETFKKWKRKQGYADIYGVDANISTLYKDAIKKAHLNPSRAYEELGIIKTNLNFEKHLPEKEREKLYQMIENERNRLGKDKDFTAKRQVQIAESIENKNNNNYMKRIQNAEEKPTNAFAELMLVRNAVNFDKTLTEKEKENILDQVEKKEKILHSDKNFMSKRQELISSALAGGSLKQKAERETGEQKLDRMEKLIAKLEKMDTAKRMNITDPLERQIINNYNTDDSSKKDSEILLGILEKRKKELSKSKSEENDVYIKNINMILDGVERIEGVKAISQQELKKVDLKKQFNKFLDETIEKKGQKKTKKKTKPKPEFLIKVSKDDISKELAENSFRGVSHTPDRRGEVARDQYVNHINDFQKELFDKVPKSEHAELKKELELYKDKFKGRYVDQLSRQGRIVSSVIAGRSNFPAKRMQDRDDVYQRKQKELWEWDSRVKKSIKKKFGIGGSKAISSDDKEAVSKLDAKIQKLERRQQFMKDVNKVVKSKKFTEKQKVENLEKNFKISKSVAIEFLKPDFAGRKGFPSFELTNNNANIRRLKTRTKTVGKAQSQTTTKRIEKGVEIVDNVDNNRLQLFFGGKPSESNRKKLKSLGFRFSPSNDNAWQRQRSSQANDNAKIFLKEYTE